MPFPLTLWRKKAIGEALKRRVRSSAGEHYLHTVGVTGSIPVAPTTP